MTGGCHGYYEIDTGRIAIDTRLSANGKVKTRCHELAHALIRRERQESDPELDRASEELVVESVAFTCVGALGIRADGYWFRTSPHGPRTPTSRCSSRPRR